MVDVTTRQLHNELFLFESLNAYGTCLGTLLHDEGLDPVDLGHVRGDGVVETG